MSIHDAADVLRAVEVGKPGSAYELSIVTHHPKGSAAPRGRVALPKDPRTGKEILLVFAEGRAAETAKKLGANYVGAEELIKPIMDGTILPTKVICTPSVLPKINKLARVLGPKGLMPSPRRGTVTDDIAGMIRSMAGTLDWKGDKEGVVRVAIGRLNYTPEELEKNVSTFVEHVRTITAPKDDLLGNKKASSVPSVLRVFLGSTRGPGIPLAI
ncbi:ribosomal protein L1 [Clavulina sp. PMI_390]|nr:ribosomal protein L1 [Clavulina sp. PMI_390]